MADLLEEQLDPSADFSNIGVEQFGPFHCEDWAMKRKAIRLSVQMSI